MSTKPLGPPPILADDPGPWSVISMVFGQAGRPGRRRPQPPVGLMLSPAPETALALVGLDAASPVAGIGRLRVVGAAREAAFALSFDDASVLRGVSPYVARTWSVPDLGLLSEDRPSEDPVVGLPDPIPPSELTAGGHTPIATAPGGDVVAVHTREGRSDVVAVIRLSDGSLVRWIRGARSAAWSPDGSHFAVGGHWGLLVATAKVDAAAS